MSKDVEYAKPGTATYVRGMWSKAVQQYLSYISEDTSLSMEELILKMNVSLGTEGDIVGLLFNVTDDKAFEMFVFKSGEGEDDPINAELSDVVIVNRLLKEAVIDIGKAS